MAKPSFNLDDDIDKWVEDRLVYGQTKSAWYRYAVRTTMECDEVLDELFEKYEYDKRREFVLNAVSEKVKETKRNADRESK